MDLPKELLNDLLAMAQDQEEEEARKADVAKRAGMPELDAMIEEAKESDPEINHFCQLISQSIKRGNGLGVRIDQACRIMAVSTDTRKLLGCKTLIVVLNSAIAQIESMIEDIGKKAEPTAETSPADKEG